MRLQTLTLGYSLPEVAAAPSAYVEVPLLCHPGYNLFTITNYSDMILR